MTRILFLWGGLKGIRDELGHLTKFGQFTLHCLDLCSQFPEIGFQALNVFLTGQGDHRAVLATATALPTATTGIKFGFGVHGATPWRKII
jgi:hypothetical protein